MRAVSEELRVSQTALRDGAFHDVHSVVYPELFEAPVFSQLFTSLWPLYAALRGALRDSLEAEERQRA